jgi:elongation factor 1-gamma
LFRQVPAFESSDGLCLTESNAIAYFLANEQLRGGSCVINQVRPVKRVDI